MLTELTEDNGIRRKYVIKSDDDNTTAKEKVRQLIQAKAQRVRRFGKRGKQFRQNSLQFRQRL